MEMWHEEEINPELNRIFVYMQPRLIRIASTEVSVTSLLGLINWTAQCARRIYFPIDSSERSGFPAFEYAWKAFNGLYSKFDGNYERDKIRACIKSNVSGSKEFVTSNEDNIILLCDTILSHEFLSHVMARDLYRILDKTRKISRQIKKDLKNGQIDNVPQMVAVLMYEFRNARFHGDYVIASSVKHKMINGEQYILETVTHFRVFPLILFEILIYMLSDLIGADKNELRLMIGSFVHAYVNDIKKTVLEGWNVSDIDRIPRLIK